MLRIGFATATALVLGGCVVGPDWHRPATVQQTRYVAGHPADRTGSAAGDDGAAQVFEHGQALRRDWYRVFGNAALDGLIKQALAANPGRAADEARLAAARETVTAVAGGRYPSLSVGAGVSRNRASGSSFGIQDPAFVNTFNLYQTQLSASYDLDLFGALTRRIENRQALAAVAQARLFDTEATLVDNIVAGALDEAGARSALQSVRNIAARQRQTVELVHQQIRYGVSLQSDALRAQSQLDDTEALIPDLQQQISVARHRLAILTGQPPAQFSDPGFTLDDFRLPTHLPVALPSQLVRQRPDIVAAEQLMHAAQARVGVATAALLPQIRLTAGYGRIGLHPGDLIDPPAEIFDFGAGLMAPLFEGGTLHARKRRAVDNYRAAAADYRTTVLRAFDQVADSLRALQHDADRLAARARARSEARHALKLVEAQQQQGAADAVSLYLAQIALQRTEISYIHARLARLADTANLARALGGGWWPAARTAATRPPPSSSAAKS